jgi:hypothetical protein
MASRNSLRRCAFATPEEESRLSGLVASSMGAYLKQYVLVDVNISQASESLVHVDWSVPRRGQTSRLIDPEIANSTSRINNDSYSH